MPTPALRALAPDLWVADRPFRVLGFIGIGTRMTVIRLPEGGLFVHSPVEADAETRAAVEALGPVRCIVAPNAVHHLFAAGWKEAHPGARLHVAEPLRRKRPDLPFDAVLGDEPDPACGDVIAQIGMQGAPYISETVFLHRPSRTLLVTDLAFHPTPASPPGLRRWTRLTGLRGDFGPNAMVRLLIRDRAAFRASLERVLAWDFDRVTVTHGEVLETGGRAALERAYAFLLEREEAGRRRRAG